MLSIQTATLALQMRMEQAVAKVIEMSESQSDSDVFSFGKVVSACQGGAGGGGAAGPPRRRPLNYGVFRAQIRPPPPAGGGKGLDSGAQAATATGSGGKRMREAFCAGIWNPRGLSPG